MSDSREVIIRRIRAFLARSGDAASTEAEAMKAARVAAKLMDEHGITSAEIDGSVATTAMILEQVYVPVVWQQTFYNSCAAVAIGQYTGTAVFVRRKKGGKRDISINYYGEPADVKFAIWLTEVVGNFIVRGCDQDLRGRGLDRRQTADFRFGYLHAAANRIAARLTELRQERDQTRTGSNLPALLSKADTAKQELESKMPLQKGKAASRSTTQEALDLGAARGNKAPINRGVEHTSHRALT